MQQTKFVYERQMNGWSASEQARKKIEGGERENKRERARESWREGERSGGHVYVCTAYNGNSVDVSMLGIFVFGIQFIKMVFILICQLFYADIQHSVYIWIALG